MVGALVLTAAILAGYAEGVLLPSSGRSHVAALALQMGSSFGEGMCVAEERARSKRQGGFVALLSAPEPLSLRGDFDIFFRTCSCGVASASRRSLILRPSCAELLDTALNQCEHSGLFQSCEGAGGLARPRHDSSAEECCVVDRAIKVAGLRLRGGASKVSTSGEAAQEGANEEEEEEARRKDEELIRQLQVMRGEVSQVQERVHSVEAEIEDHIMCKSVMADFEPSRRCHRAIGGVLMEQNVGTTLPQGELCRIANRLVLKCSSTSPVCLGGFVSFCAVRERVMQSKLLLRRVTHSFFRKYRYACSLAGIVFNPISH